ncbi:unnamed protein product [Lupinus luteus]|uniref:Uncharacterized protein n=1 Tax=Lupinus luteus TaxID=3873 RepID=A0AAV1Y443_LUPLU
MVEFLVDPFLGCGDGSLCLARLSSKVCLPLAGPVDSEHDSWQNRASCWGEQNLVEDDFDDVVDVVAENLLQVEDWVGNEHILPLPMSPERCRDEDASHFISANSVAGFASHPAVIASPVSTATISALSVSMTDFLGALPTVQAVDQPVPADSNSGPATRQFDVVVSGFGVVPIVYVALVGAYDSTVVSSSVQPAVVVDVAAVSAASIPGPRFTVLLLQAPIMDRIAVGLPSVNSSNPVPVVAIVEV